MMPALHQPSVFSRLFEAFDLLIVLLGRSSEIRKVRPIEVIIRPISAPFDGFKY